MKQPGKSGHAKLQTKGREYASPQQSLSSTSAFGSSASWDAILLSVSIHKSGMVLLLLLLYYSTTLLLYHSTTLLLFYSSTLLLFYSTTTLLLLYYSTTLLRYTTVHYTALRYTTPLLLLVLLLKGRYFGRSRADRFQNLSALDLRPAELHALSHP